MPISFLVVRVLGFLMISKVILLGQVIILVIIFVRDALKLSVVEHRVCRDRISAHEFSVPRVLHRVTDMLLVQI